MMQGACARGIAAQQAGAGARRQVLHAVPTACLLPNRSQDKGTDVVEGQKLYARIFRALSNLGIRI